MLRILLACLLLGLGGASAAAAAPDPIPLGGLLRVQLRDLPEGWRISGRSLWLGRRALRDGARATRIGREGIPFGLEIEPAAHELEVALELKTLTSPARTLDELLASGKGIPAGMRKVETDAGAFLLHEEVVKGREQLRWWPPGAEEPEHEVVPLARIQFLWVFRTGQYQGGERQLFLKVEGIADVHEGAVDLDAARMAALEVLRSPSFSGGENQTLEVEPDPVHPLAFRVELFDRATGAPGVIPEGGRLLLRVWDTDQNTGKLKDHLMLDGARVEIPLPEGKLPPRPRPTRAAPAAEDLYTIPDVAPVEAGVAGEAPRIGRPEVELEPVIDYLGALQQRAAPLVLSGPGPHEVRLWLDFARLGLFEVPPFDFAGRGLPCLEDPLRVVVRVELEGPEDARGRRRSLARARHEVRVEAVARVEWVGYQTADGYDPAQYDLHRTAARRLPVARGDLADYARTHGDKEGEGRVRVDRRGSDPDFETIREPGTLRGLPLHTGDWLRAGDRVHFDPTRMASHGFVGMQPPVCQAPAQLELSLEYLDGERGKLIVTEDAGPFSVTIGATAVGTGFLDSRVRMAYFAAGVLKEKLAEKVVVTTLSGIFPPAAGALAIADGASDVFDAVDWAFGATPEFLPRRSAAGP